MLYTFQTVTSAASAASATFPSLLYPNSKLRQIAMPFIGFHHSRHLLLPFTWPVLVALYSSIFLFPFVHSVVFASADTDARCTLEFLPSSSLNPSNVAVVNRTASGHATLLLAFKMCPYYVDTNVSLRVPPPLVVTNLTTQVSRFHQCARLNVLIHFRSPHPLTTTFTIGTHPVTCTKILRLVVPGVRISPQSSTDAIFDVAVLPSPAGGRSNSSLTLWLDALRTSGRFLPRSKLLFDAQLSVQPQLPNLNVSLLATPSPSPNLHVEWRQPPTNSHLSLVDTVTLSVLVPSLSYPSASLTLKLPSTLAVLRFRQPRAVLSSEGGDQVSAVITPKLPKGAYATLVLHHTSGNISISQSTTSSNSSPLPNLSEPVFVLPPLPPDPLTQPLPWHVFVTHAGGRSVAMDQTSGFKFIILHPPKISQILPQRMHVPPTQTIVYLLGSNLQAGVIIQDGFSLPSSRIISISSTHIAFKLVRSFRQISRPRQINISVISPQRLKSDRVVLTIDPNLPVFTARVLNAVQSSTIRQFSIPAPCGTWQQPTVSASLLLRSDLPITYNFSLRLDAAPSDGFSTLYSGNSSIATINDTSLFSLSPQSNQRTFAVLVVASHNYSDYSTIIIVNRFVKDKVLGLSVSEMPGGSSYLDPALQLQAFVPPLTSCAIDTSYLVKFFWKIDDESVLSPLGNSIFVTSTAAFTYTVDVHVVDYSGKVVLKGSACGNVGKRNTPVSVAINGGLSSVILPTGLESYQIRAEVLSAVFTPTLLLEWSCVELPQRTPCLSPLWSASSRSTSVFNISTLGVEVGPSVEYSIQVSDGATLLQTSKMMLTVGSEDIIPFPETVMRSYGSTDPGTIIKDHNFHCFERVLLSWDAELRDNLSLSNSFFWLKQEPFHDVNILRERSDVLLSYNGYWSLQNRSVRLLGIDLSTLVNGEYKLFAATGDNDQSTPTLSWDISVRSCVTAYISDPSSYSGIANRTLFHISVFTKPSVQGVYVLSLQNQNSTATNSEQEHNLLHLSSQSSRDHNISSPISCRIITRGSYNGATLSFVAPYSGEFYVNVDVYDISGSRLLATVQTSRSISVTSNFDTKHMDAETFLTSAILQSRHDCVVSVLKTLPIQTNLSETLLEALTSEIILLSYHRSPPVVTVADIIHASETLVVLDASRNLTRQSYLRNGVERLVASSLAHATSEGTLRHPLQSFYSTSNRLLGVFDREERNENMLQRLDENRQSATNVFSVLMSTGRECGSVERVVIALGPPSEFDEYRLGIECYFGQVSALPPEPYTYEICNNDINLRKVGHESIVMTFEQVDVAFQEQTASIVRSPIVESFFLSRVTDLNIVSTSFLTRSSVCYRTRLVVNSSAFEIPSTLRQSQNFYCHGAGEIIVQSGNASQDFSSQAMSTVSEFSLYNDTHIFVSTVLTESVALQLRLNTTTLKECQASNVSVQASSLRLVSIVTGVVIAVGLFLIIMIILFLLRRRRKPLRVSIPRDGRGWDAMLESASYTASSDRSFGFVERDSRSSHITGWDEAYETTENRRAGSVLVHDDQYSVYGDRAFVNEDVLAYGDRSVEELGASRGFGTYGGVESLRYSSARLGDTSEDDLTDATSGDRGTTDTSGLTTPIPSHSATMSSSIDGYIHTSESSTEENELTDAYILPDVFGRSIEGRRGSV